MSKVTSIDKNETIPEIIAPKPLTVKDEYASLVPQISEQEYQTIRQSIKDNGQWVPIITNPQLIILDGHTRCRACEELGLEPRIMVREFKDPLLEKQRQFHLLYFVVNFASLIVYTVICHSMSVFRLLSILLQYPTRHHFPPFVE